MFLFNFCVISFSISMCAHPWTVESKALIPLLVHTAILWTVKLEVLGSRGVFLILIAKLLILNFRVDLIQTPCGLSHLQEDPLWFKNILKVTVVFFYRNPPQVSQKPHLDLYGFTYPYPLWFWTSSRKPTMSYLIIQIQQRQPIWASDLMWEVVCAEKVKHRNF